jgi:hypothetical protein
MACLVLGLVPVTYNFRRKVGAADSLMLADSRCWFRLSAKAKNAPRVGHVRHDPCIVGPSPQDSGGDRGGPAA